MSAAIDITGVRFGKLLALERNGSNKDKKALWKCVCDCGEVIDRTYKALKKNKEQYCGDMHPTKICTKCKLEKNKEADYHKTTQDGKKSIQPVCKQCKAEFYIENREEITKKYNDGYKDPCIRERRRKIGYASWQKNKHKELAYKRVYDKRPEVIERRKRIHQERKANDPDYNMRKRLRWRLRDAVKKVYGKGFKYKSSLVLLGCDMEFFKAYIESKFQEGMNWDRFAYIHLDHIKPCSKFDLTKYEDQKACFHYSNIQPLWEIDNLLKSYKWDGD